jgi:chromosome segregation ATPase
LQAALAAVHAQLDELRNESSREVRRLQVDRQRMRDAKLAAEQQLENEISNMRVDVNEAIDAANSEVEQAKRDAVAASAETGILRKQIEVLKTELRQSEQRAEELGISIAEQQRRHARELSARVPGHDLANKTAELERLRASHQDIKDRCDRLCAELGQKSAELTRAEERISDSAAEQGAVLADLEDFERDLNAQRSAARRLTEELRILQEDQTGKADMAALREQYEVVVGQLRVLKVGEGEAAERQHEMARVGKEYKAVKAEMRALDRELRLVREERGELDQWKMTHVCET